MTCVTKFQRHFLVVHGRGSWVRIWYICWVVSGTYNGLLIKYLHICLAPGLSISIKSDGAFTHASISGFKSESINIYNQEIKLEYLTTACTFTHIIVSLIYYAQCHEWCPIVVVFIEQINKNLSKYNSGFLERKLCKILSLFKTLKTSLCT